MRKLIAVEQLTLDGVMQGPGHPEEDRFGGFEHGGWHVPYFDPVAGERAGASMGETDAFLFGRRTYEIMASYWPHAPAGDMFAGILNGAAKHVASTTLEEPLEWKNSTLLKGPVPDAVRALKNEPGKNIVVLGSGHLVRSLLRHDLVDELSLMIDPLILGSGLKLFDGVAERRSFRLVDAVTTTTGVIMAQYQLER